ncbi:MAG TPA: ribose 5-phosphate isomerase B [Chroococcales cyanobacterium]|jgi:ribose 5-phosphate isomerase B
MRIAIGSDHAGFPLKEGLRKRLVETGHSVEDLGCYNTERVDYPIVAQELARKVSGGEFERGVLVCGSGIGVSIAANRIAGARAALCSEPLSAHLSREHNDANILCLGARLIGEDMALVILAAFLETPFSGGRHQQRVALLDD